MPVQQRRSLLDAASTEQAIARMAREILDRVGGIDDLVLVGIHRRGVEISARIASEIANLENQVPLTGMLDINLYRDDLMTVGPQPVVGASRIPNGGINGRQVVIVDDVLYTGRTVRAALAELADFGRPARTLLAVLVDRGGRELPIHADVVGMTVEVPEGMEVEVSVPEIDERLGVDLVAMEI
jgi:pyrimidine operon attenuation protein / uracil phosphoribosyltransferase